MSAVSIIFKENDLMHVSTTTLSCQKMIWTGSWDTKNEMQRHIDWAVQRLLECQERRKTLHLGREGVRHD